MGSSHNEPLGFHGIAKDNSNSIKTSSVPAYMLPVFSMYCNLDGYSTSCKEYAQYEQWLKVRNEQRYVEDKTSGQRINGKNILHLRRLLDTAKEIATEGTIYVRRKNREELLQIRRGEVSLASIIEKSQDDIIELKELFNSSSLPESIDQETVNNILLEIRNEVIWI